MKKSEYLILGGGMVAGYAARELAERGLKPGELTILSADSVLPYERPPLSKGFLAGKDTEDGIRINAEDFYRAHEIDVRLRHEIVGIDIRQKLLRARSGEELGFEKLVIATGARARTLEVTGAELPGVHCLRSMDDSRRIHEHAENARRALVIGGGFIAMEVASVLSEKGLEVTMILRQDRIWKQFFTAAMSGYFESYYAAHGVQFVREAEVAALEGKAAVAAVRLKSGRTIEGDLVVAGVGAVPVTEVLANSGIEVTDGVAVNEYLEASRPGVYAAGDVANYPDTLFGKRRRVEHWDNAVSQGRHCARGLLGERAPFVHVPYFFSDVFDLSYEFWGDVSGAGEVVERGDLSTNSFSVWWLKGNQLVAAFAMNRPDEEREAAPRWIESKQRLSGGALRERSSVADALA